MNIAFRVDASVHIGIGHLMRCLTLADALKALGTRTHFVCRHLPESLASILQQKGHELSLVFGGADVEVDSALAHSRWLGISQSHDAECMMRELAGKKWDWLVVDHYALDGY